MNNPNIINKAVKVLKAGGVVIFPTDTVWGIGCSIERPEAIERLYKIKQREQNKPTAVLVGSLGQAKALGKFNAQALTLAQKYWPGGLTIIVKAKLIVPQSILGPNNTIGIRVPNHPLFISIVNNLGCGIIAASANFSDQPAPKKKNELDDKLIKLVDYFIDGESSGLAASTVVDTTQSPIKIIRQGSIKIRD